jgi:hypothetical protein
MLNTHRNTREDVMMQKRERRCTKLLAVLVVLGLVLAAGVVPAQDVANGRATANVLSGLTVIATQDLQFLDVLQGVAKSVGYNVDAQSGIFTILGNTGSGISVYLTLPDYIALADGSDRMVISFSTTDCAIDQNGATPSSIGAGDGFIDQDPHNLPNGIVIGIPTTRIYLGGRVTPTIDQLAGAYYGDIICSVAYNGT